VTVPKGLAAWLKRHSIRVGEAAWYVAVVLFSAYRFAGQYVGLPLLPTEWTPWVFVALLTGLYVTSKWSEWTDRPKLRLSQTLQLDSIWYGGSPATTMARLATFGRRSQMRLIHAVTR
jgi:hypothetical protein